MTGTKTCRRCGGSKSASLLYFKGSAKSKDGLTSSCRQCLRLSQLIGYYRKRVADLEARTASAKERLSALRASANLLSSRELSPREAEDFLFTIPAPTEGLSDE